VPFDQQTTIADNERLRIPQRDGWVHIRDHLSAAEREQLAAIVADRNRPRKHVERARIVLASADRHAAQQVARHSSR